MNERLKDFSGVLTSFVSITMGCSQSYSPIALVQWYLEGSRLYGIQGFNVAKTSFRPEDIGNLRNKVVLVTGANKGKQKHLQLLQIYKPIFTARNNVLGLGFAAAAKIAELGGETHLLCRNKESCDEACKIIKNQYDGANVHGHVCDISSMIQVRNFAAQFVKQHSKLDVLINNAGCMPSTRITTDEGNESIFATMIGGTLLLTSLLVPSLEKSPESRVINVSSGGAYSVAARVDDLNCSNMNYDGTLFYAFAKRAQILLSEKMSCRLKLKNIAVNAMHPGWADTEGLRTAMPDFHAQNGNTLRSAMQGADTIVFLAACDRIKGSTGLFWFDRQPVRTHMPFGFTESSAAEVEMLWDNCVKYVGGL